MGVGTLGPGAGEGDRMLGRCCDGFARQSFMTRVTSARLVPSNFHIVTDMGQRRPQVWL